MSIELTNEQVHAIYKAENWFNSPDSKQVFEISGAAGTGKAQPDDTIIPTPNGRRLLGSLNVGDTVFNREGNPVKINGIFIKGLLDTYKVTFEDGRSTECNLDHLWTVCNKNKEFSILTTKIIKKRMDENNEIFYVPINKEVKFNNVFNLEDEVIEREAYELSHNIIDTIKTSLVEDDCSYLDIIKNSSVEIRKIFLIYFFSEIKERIFFKKGSDKKSFIISFSNKEVLEYISYLERSIGNLSSTPKNSIKDMYSMDSSDKWINFENKEIDINLIEESSNKNSYFVYIEEFDDESVHCSRIVSIEDLHKKKEMRCIYVDDKEHLYLTNDFIVTHNTTLTLYIIERLGLELSEVAFVAYMGKAASRLSQQGLPAQTIHSAIYKYVKRYKRDENGRIVYGSNGKPVKTGEFILKDQIAKGIKLIVLDEASMVNKEIAEDLLSFDIPVIALGDLNQLPPVFGKPYFLQNPDVILTKVMRQHEGDPIIYLSQRALKGLPLIPSTYGKTRVITQEDLEPSDFSSADIILTETNRTRWNINNYMRQYIRGYKHLDQPHIGEKLVCRKNNWAKSIGHHIYLTNGTCGIITDLQKSSFDGKSMVMDFKPDFTDKVFRNVKFNYAFLNRIPESALSDEDKKHVDPEIYNIYLNKFEYAYSITVHLSQGSQYPKVLYLNENMMRNKEDRERLMYTAITRAETSITIVI